LSDLLSPPDARPPRVCVVIPTYNEALNIRRCLTRTFEAANEVESHELFVLVVDDESPDGTSLLVKDLQEQYPNLHLLSGRKTGLGDAYKRGFAYAIERLEAEFIIQMDADGQHEPHMIPLLIEVARRGFNLVIGSRYVFGGALESFSLYRRTLSRLGNLLVRYLGGVARIHDCTSGFRCISTKLIQHCDLSFMSTRGYSFQSALLCELIHNRATAIEVPIQFRKRTDGESKLTLQDQREFLWSVAKLRFRNHKEFLRYALVGSFGVAINLGTYSLLTRTLSVQPELSAAIAIETSIIVNFLLHEIWTFAPRAQYSKLPAKLVKFHTVAGLSGIANYLSFLYCYRVASLTDIAASFIGITVGAAINYTLNANWTWTRR
jgi:dolichol-phosphate mannosyltransferase